MVGSLLVFPPFITFGYEWKWGIDHKNVAMLMVELWEHTGVWGTLFSIIPRKAAPYSSIMFYIPNMKHPKMNRYQRRVPEDGFQNFQGMGESHNSVVLRFIRHIHTNHWHTSPSRPSGRDLGTPYLSFMGNTNDQPGRTMEDLKKNTNEALKSKPWRKWLEVPCVISQATHAVISQQTFPPPQC